MGGGYDFQAAMVPVDGKINLSQIAIGIYKPTKDEIYKASASYASGTKFISFEGMSNRVLIEEINSIGSENIIKFTFRRDILADTLYSTPYGDYTYLALSDQKTGEENWLAVSQMLNAWLFEMQMPKVMTQPFNTGSVAWMKSETPPVLNTHVHCSDPQQRQEFANIEGSPLMVR
jgi:hypothetical protein